MTRPGRAVDWCLALTPSRPMPWLLAAAFIVAGFAAIYANVFLNNEGIYTWIFAGLTSESPRDMLFYMKARPPISLFYAAVAPAGLTPFLWAHTIVAALAIPLTASLARQFEHERPNLPALLLALSPLFLAGAWSGVQNTDGTVGLLFATWLLARNRPLAAAIVLSLAVLARIEVGFFALVLAAYAAVTPGCRRFLLAAPVVPAMFALAGAQYHGDLLWVIKYPSSTMSDPTVAPEIRAWYGGNLNSLMATVLALAPAIGAAAWATFRRSPRLERILCVAAIGFVAAIRFLPFTGLIYVDDSPRYVLPALPYLCLLIGRGVRQWGCGWRPTLVRGALLVTGASAAAVLMIRTPGLRELAWFGGSAGPLLIVAVAAAVMCAVLAFWSARGAVATLLAAAIAVGLPLLPTTHLYLGEQARQLDGCIRWLAAAHAPDGAVVVTDEHLLGIWLADYAPDLKLDVRHLVSPDMLWQGKTLADPTTRQFATVFGTSRFFYARWIFPEEIARLPGEVLFVMNNEDRKSSLSGPPFDHVQWLVNGEWAGGRLIRDSPDPEPRSDPERDRVEDPTVNRAGA